LARPLIVQVAIAWLLVGIAAAAAPRLARAPTILVNPVDAPANAVLRQ